MEPPILLSEYDEAISVKVLRRTRVDAAVALRNDLGRFAITKNVLIDWEAADHVDASVLQVLLAWRSALQRSDKTIAVEKDNADIREYLHLSGLADYFPIVEAGTAPVGACNG